MKVLFITIDSLNRHFLTSYGQPVELKVRTPNLDAFARKAATFDRHYAGSLPCMPARREFLAGVQEFLWRPWGPLEPFDRPIPRLARGAGITTQLVSDHFHYWQHGSSGYFEDYHAYQFVRGHEFDMWKAYPRSFSREQLAKVGITPEQAAEVPPYLNRVQYLRNVAGFAREEDFFAPRVFGASAEWLAGARELGSWFFYIDSFEVHEPFHVPEPYRSMYTDDDHDDPHLLWWPHYGNVSEGISALDERQVAYVRAQYAGKLTMVDRWLGRVFDQLEAGKLWDETFVVVTTDHGHYLGEKGWMGKPDCPVYNVLAHTPLFIWDPVGRRNGERASALTQAIDLYPTLVEALGCETPAGTHGRSLLPLLRGETASHRDWALYGIFGRSINITDGRYTYLRAPRPSAEARLYTYSTQVLSSWPFGPAVSRDSAESGRFLPYADAVCWRYPEEIKPASHVDDMLFDVEDDPGQEHDLAGVDRSQVTRMTTALTRALGDLGAPDEQYGRLGL